MKLACAHLSVFLAFAAGCLTPESPPPTDSAGSGGGGAAGASGQGGTGGSAGGAGVAGSGPGAGVMGGAAGGGPGGGIAGSTGGNAADASTTPDPPADARPGSADASGRADGGAGAQPIPAEGFGAGPITECATPSVGRLQQWTAHANTAPASGSLLVNQGGRFVARVRFTGVPWSEAVIPLANSEALTADLSRSAGFTITYSATAELAMQLRGNVQPHGGDQHVVRLPATGTAIEKRSFRFVPQEWTFLAGLGMPRFSLPEVLRAATIFNLVGRVANEITIHDLRFDNYVPACR